jgi:catechol 2,3-dioxygenase-like lactoylglutathione lyase family enzyme
MIEGLSHITFIVKDLERMKLLLVGALGGKEVYDSGDKWA